MAKTQEKYYIKIEKVSDPNDTDDPRVIGYQSQMVIQEIELDSRETIELVGFISQIRRRHEKYDKK